MKTTRKTAGATLVLTVLVVMLLLAAVVAVTGQLALSARRSSADQDATVQSQYIAESGVARAQARLTLINTLMGSKLTPAANLTTTTSMLTQMLQLCGNASPSSSDLAATPTGSFLAPVTLCPATGGPTDLLSGVSNLATSSRLNFFTSPNNIALSAFAESGFNLSSLNADPATAAKLFWAQSLTNPQVNSSTGVSFSGKVGDLATNSVSGKMGLSLMQVQRFGTDSYRLTFAVPDVASTATTSGAGRSLTVEGVSKTYSYEISRNGFAKYALFTNHHFANAAAESGCASTPSSCNRVTFTSNTLFSGPVHSNQNYLIQGTPYFAGQVTSAGCPPGAITAATDANGQPTERCSATATPGAYFQSTALTSPSSMQPNPTAPVACNVAVTATSPCPAANTINPQFQGGVDWNAGFQPLPKNSNDQATAAANGGLSFSGNVASLNLAAGSIIPNGGSVTPAQLITYKQTTSGTPVQLAATADNSMYIAVTVAGATVWQKAVQVNGTWVSALSAAGQAAIANGTAKTSFNGVIYATGSIASLTGPPRTTASDPATAPAALAAFSQVTVAAAGDIHIKSDLKYSTPPCTGSNSVSGTTFTAAPCTNAGDDNKNILGIYSSGGDVDIDSPAIHNTAADPGVGKNVTIQGVLMASTGRVTVDGYDQGTADSNVLGQVNLLGGIIENYYGPFGITDGHGFGRNYVYDPRTGNGLAPPSFPTQQAWNTDFKLTTSTSGSSNPTPLQLEGSQTQQGIQ